MKSLLDKDIIIQFRSPCLLTLFSKNLDIHDLSQFKKALNLINEVNLKNKICQISLKRKENTFLNQQASL